MLRLLIFSFLAKLHLKRSDEHLRQLNTLKCIIYSSKLNPDLTEKKGLEAEQLLKMIAQKMTRLLISEEAEEELCRVMNC